MDELRHNARALNIAADLFLSEAGFLALDVPQLVSLAVSPSHAMVNWKVMETVVRGNTISAWTSTHATHALLGAARFSLCLRSETRPAFVGAKAVDAEIMFHRHKTLRSYLHRLFYMS